MSFLNSVLSSIGGDGPKSITSKVKPASNPALRNGGDSTKSLSVQNAHSVAMNGAISNSKRKADAELSRPTDKLLRMNTSIPERSNGYGPSTKTTTPSKPVVKPIARPSVQTNSSTSSVPYRGTGKPSPLTPTATELKAPPKKGSYAEIMARGKVVQTTTAPVGTIKHKPKEKLSTKKELLMQKKGLLLNGKPGLTSKSAPGSISSSPAPASQPRDGKSNGKKAPPTGYTGTAKPKPLTSYKGTMKPISPAPSSHRKNYPPSSGSDHSTAGRKPTLDSSRRRSSYSDEESEEQEEGYESESDLSDMEAGFSDVEEENERAAKAAKKEDEAESRKLDELKRQKEAKKSRLLELAKKAQQRR